MSFCQHLYDVSHYETIEATPDDDVVFVQTIRAIHRSLCHALDFMPHVAALTHTPSCSGEQHMLFTLMPCYVDARHQCLSCTTGGIAVSMFFAKRFQQMSRKCCRSSTPFCKTLEMVQAMQPLASSFDSLWAGCGSAVWPPSCTDSLLKMSLVNSCHFPFRGLMGIQLRWVPRMDHAYPYNMQGYCGNNNTLWVILSGKNNIHTQCRKPQQNQALSAICSNRFKITYPTKSMFVLSPFNYVLNA